MTKHFRRELEKIKQMILSVGTLVEEQVRLATHAIDTTDAQIAEKVIQLDHEVDEMEVEVEEECLKAMALYQPVAVDLRFLVAVIKINNDLERIGDQAVNIAQRLNILAGKAPMQFVFDYTPMCEKTMKMLKMSLDALVNMDIDMAINVCHLDDEVDEIKHQAYDTIKQAMKLSPDRIGYLINLFLISRHLERISDHATNIAEEVIYMIEGEIVRHGNPDTVK